MLHLIARFEGLSCAAPAARILEVLPLVRLQRTPGPAHLASFRHRGRLAVALDLSLMLLGRPCNSRISTRMLIAPRADGETVGVICEHVAEMAQIPDDAWAAAPRPGEPPYLGPAALRDAETVRRLELDALFDVAFGEFARSA